MAEALTNSRSERWFDLFASSPSLDPRRNGGHDAHFMNKFRTMGQIESNGKLTIRTELLTDLVLHD